MPSRLKAVGPTLKTGVVFVRKNVRISEIPCRWGRFAAVIRTS